MTMDMQQFHTVFFQESEEHLHDMETMLMQVSPEEPDAEILNCIFRAAHSIKGGSGIFGLDALTGLTHVMESILDQARQETLLLTTEIVDALLDSTDTLKGILESYRTETPIDWETIEKDSKRLEAIVNQKADDSNQQESEQGFGFFEHSPTSSNDDDAFGFFDEPGESSSASDDEDDGFGFFTEELPAQTNAENETADTGSTPIKDKIKPTHESPMKQQATSDAKLDPSAKTSQTVSGSKTPGSNIAEKSRADSGSIRIDTDKLDSLVNLVGEIVITQSMLSVISTEINDGTESKLSIAVDELERNTREIQESVMSMRMLPISFVFNRFPRVVRSLSRQLNKQVELVIEGGTTEIDKGLIEKLVDPLTHLIRNSVDHGIEIPSVREQNNKIQTGTVKLIAEQRAGNILIRIIDDGGGLDREKILAKAIDRGFSIDPSASNDEVWKLIFEPGFSTADAVTDVSGRGVGMDVVRRNIESINGQIEIKSTPGVGSEFNISLPLTLAIVDGMVVTVGDQLYVIPLASIIESIQPNTEQVKLIGNDRLLWVREEYWPILDLYKTMGIEPEETDPSKAVLVLIESRNKRFALLVDSLVGQQQVVIKSLEDNYRKVPGVSGATIMGDGRVALILDVESLSSQVPEKLALKE